MENNSARLDGLYHALSDATRRAVVESLVSGPATVSDLAAPHAITLPTFLKHLRVLHDSGLVRTEKKGRVRTCYLQAEALRTAQAWFERHRTAMERKLDRMAALAEELERSAKRS